MNPKGKPANIQFPLSWFIPETYLEKKNVFPPGLILLSESGAEIYERALVQLADWPKETRDALSAHLYLQYKPHPRDEGGNVCFADDPGMRPDFRTWFHAAHLFDYYYALWQMNPPSEEELKFRFFDLPRPSVFWALIEIGKRLRKLHMSSHAPNPEIELRSDSQEKSTMKIGDIHFIADKNQTKGRLYLNREQYLYPVPEEAWKYQLEGETILNRLLHLQTTTTSSDPELPPISGLIHVLAESYELQQGVRRTLDRYR